MMKLIVPDLTLDNKQNILQAQRTGEQHREKGAGVVVREGGEVRKEESGISGSESPLKMYKFSESCETRTVVNH